MNVKRSTMTKQVYQIIKDKIISGEYKQGQKLTEQGVANELEVSATPVREAFKNLASEGFIESISYRGVFVKEYTRKEIREAYLVRAKLEGLVVKLLMERITTDMILQLEEIKKEVMESNEENVVLRFYPISSGIYKMADSQILTRNVLAINAIVNLESVMNLDKKINAKVHAEGRLKLIEYILKKESEKAIKQAEINVLQIMEVVLENYDQEII